MDYYSFNMRKFASRWLPLCLLSLTVAPAFAQRDLAGAAEVEQSLKRVTQLGRVLMIAAHPDDESTAVLAYFARGRNMRAAYLSLTRGEGGQNLIGSEQGDELGVIRTQELLAARRIDGAEQFFTRAVDFGFSKSAPETLEKWGHDQVLSDIVWVIRRFRPDVVIQRFSGTPRDGHGNHQASGMLSKEAFRAAGDPARFPEQLRYVQPWRAKRLVQNLPNFTREMEEAAAATANRVEVPTGEYNPVLGYSYEEIAGMSRSQHRSQGMGSPERRGAGRNFFATLEGDPAKIDLFDGVETSWKRLPGGAPVGAILSEAVQKFEPAHPEKSLPLLAKARTLAAAMTDLLAKEKLAELDETIGLCVGLWADAQAPAAYATPGTNVTVTARLLNRSPVNVELKSAALEGALTGQAAGKLLPNNENVAVEFRAAVPGAQPPSRPYWLAKPRQGELYAVDDQQLIGLADTPPVARIRFHLSADGTPFEIVRPVHNRYVDRVEGERTRPFVIVPAVSLNLPDNVVVFPASTPRTVHVAVQANVAKAAGEVRLDLAPGWKSAPASAPFRIEAAGEQQEVVFDVTPPEGETLGRMRALTTVEGREIASGIRVIAYPHIPTQTLFPPADGKLVRSDVRVTARRIGYVMGAGDEMPDALRQLGLEVTLLSKSDLEQRNLSEFDAIVAGVRAYNVRADVRANQSRLLDYVRNGGTYVVQYQVGDNSLNVGPYPMTIPPGSRFRVDVEDAPVTLPHPDSPLLQTPNRITPRDFEGWVQERGLYFASEWDPRYQTVLESHDPDEPNMAGGELWTRYGKGVYIFTSWAWFRQLPAGVSGAYRMFANLLSAK